MANPGNPLHYNAHQAAPPVSTLAHSRGPEKMSQSPCQVNVPARIRGWNGGALLRAGFIIVRSHSVAKKEK